MKNNRIVIDTNVFISAIIRNSGYPYQIFKELIASGSFQVCLSEQLLDEYRGVARREKFNRYAGFQKRAEELLHFLENMALMVYPTRTFSILDDDPDNRLLEIAVEADAYAIVTGNFRDFDFLSFENVRIFSPAAFYEAVASEKA